ncbi:LptM family lipoprotein [Clostridium estertheticum]|uniref:LptM family lipoprotein n=1 Tax=Clostridium estertheticum TaxID=238834 RepID=UPI001C0BA3BC|nr:hypothetical protein [Clostridium estertheticum]MBU3173972.1 hypothetical protein [Clostridium estertheticum]
MKKFLSCLLILFCILSIAGCSNKKEEEKIKKNAFEIKTANNVVLSYMNFIMKEDFENGKKLYTKDLYRKATDLPISNMKIKGYKVTESNEVGRSGVFKVRVSRTSIGSSLSCVDEYSIKIVKDGAEYKISEITNTPQKEAFIEGTGIRFRDKKNVKTNLIIDVSGIPKYSYSKDDGAKLYKIMVPLKEFGPMNFSYEGDKIAFSTYNKNTFIGIVNIDESLEVQAKGNADQPGQSSQGGGSGAMAKEKPIGKDLIPIDLLFDSKVEFMTFSMDEKFLLVQYNSEKTGKCIRVYKVDNGDMIPINFEKDYPIEKVQIIFSSFGEDNMTYEVISKSNSNGAEGDIIGKWKLNLKDFTVKKL